MVGWHHRLDGRVQQRPRSPRKADVKAECSSQLLDDVKGGVDCWVDAGGEGWQRKGLGGMVPLKGTASLRLRALPFQKGLLCTPLLLLQWEAM